MHHKGFTLIEVLLVLVITGMSMFFIPKISFNQTSESIDLYESTLIHTQFVALITHIEQTPFNNPSIHFNESAYINEAQTIDLGSKDLVLLLGPGRMYVKR